MIYLPIVMLSFYLIANELLTRHYRKEIKLVIHVNGIRGKSTIVRMLDAVFREHGYQTFSKVTGTYPRYTSVDGVERDIKRVNANILEQRRFLKKAYKDKAEVLIIECMALNPELQSISERFLKSDVTIISNVKIDHLEVMGESHYEIGRTLLKSAPEKNLVIVGDTYLHENYYELNNNIVMANSYEAIEGEYKSNTDIVFELANRLKLDTDISKEAIRSYKKETISNSIIKFKNSKVEMGFDVNDLESTIEKYISYKRKLKREYKRKNEIIWFNDRMDRPYRSKVFIKWLVSISPDRIILSGDRLKENKIALVKHGFNGAIVEIDKFNGKDEYILGIGNIKGLDSIISEE